MIMREIDLSEAQEHLSQLLDDVEHGETIVITRHGRPVALLVPDAVAKQADAAAAVAAIKAFQENSGRITVEDLLSARDEGRK
jgi:prevent-host-death family protein